MNKEFEKFSWNDAIRELQDNHVTFKNVVAESLTAKQKLKISNSKLASIELIMLDYYNGEFDTIGDLAGAISFVLNGDEND